VEKGAVNFGAAYIQLDVSCAHWNQLLVL